MNDMNNEKNKSAVILNPERSEWVSRSHVTGVEIVVNDGVKTKRYSAKRDLYGDFAYAQPLKMTTTASCREAHKRRCLFNLIQRSLEKFFKKNFRDDSFFEASPKDTFYRHSEPKAKNPKSNIKDWILRFANAPLRMTIPALALLFTIATTAESKAQIEEACDCGKNCCYQLENGVLNFYRKDDSQDAQINAKVFWFKGLTDIIIPEGFSAVGDGIFANGMQSHIPENATNLNKLKSVSIPSSLKKAGYMLYYLTGLKEIIIPDDIDFSDWRYDTFYQSTSNLTVVCQGDIEICKQKVNDSNIFPQSKKFLSADRNRCNNPNYYWSGSECTKRPTDGTDILCDYDFSGYIKIGNNCYSPEETYAKKHYTPAEANEWLHDGNDNFVVITFKK